MRRIGYLFLGALLACFAAGGSILAQEQPADDAAPTDVQPTDPAVGDEPTADEPLDDPDPVPEMELHGAVKGLTNALNASVNRSENAVEVLNGNLMGAMERQGIAPDPVAPDGGDTVDATPMETTTLEMPTKPVKPERLERAERPEKPEKPERPGRPDRP